MVTFEPPELRGQLLCSLSTWVGFGWDVPADLNEDEWDTSPGDDDQTLSGSSMIDLSLPSHDEGISISCREFIDTMIELSTAKLEGNQKCRSFKRVLVRVEAVSEEARKLVWHSLPESDSDGDLERKAQLVAESTRLRELRSISPELETSIPDSMTSAFREYLDLLKSIQDTKSALEKKTRRFCVLQMTHKDAHVKVSLTTGFTIFGLKGIAEGLYHEYFQYFSDQEAFVEIQNSASISDDGCDAIVHSYLFELAASLCAEFRIAPRPVYEESEDDELEPILADVRLRPLMVGKGISDLCFLYSKIVETSDPEFQILFATKVLEYVSQTVVTLKAQGTLRAKLLTAQALNPDARFLSELQAIAAKNERLSSKDKDAIKETVLTCCDATELARRVPPFLAEFHVITLASDTQTQRTALGKFALSLYSTRNSIAHAKANYEPTGNECPQEHLAAFAEAAKAAAQMVVRWFYGVSEDLRVVS